MSRLWKMGCGVCEQRIVVEYGEVLGRCPGCRALTCNECWDDDAECCRLCAEEQRHQDLLTEVGVSPSGRSTRQGEGT